MRDFVATLKLTIKQLVWEGEIQTPKTKNAYRQVDLSPDLANLLKSFLAERQSGFLFANRAGKPLSQTNLLRRYLHPALDELQVPKAGFHAMRRFRATWLRKQRAPEDLIKFWAWSCRTVGNGWLLQTGRCRA